MNEPQPHFKKSITHPSTLKDNCYGILIYIQGVCICQALKIGFNPVFPYKVLKTLSRSGRKWHLNFWQSKRFVFLLLLSVDPEGSSLRKIDVWGRQIHIQEQIFKKIVFNLPLLLTSFKKSHVD